MDFPVIDPDASDLTGDLLDRARAGDDDAQDDASSTAAVAAKRWKTVTRPGLLNA